MGKLILVTVGTSALFNEYSGWEYDNNDKEKWKKTENLIRDLEVEVMSGEYNQEDSTYQHKKEQALYSLRSNLETYYNNGIGLDTLSAELASLLQMNNELGEITNQDKIVLLHSDTADGKICAEINKDIIQSDIVINGKIKKKSWNVDSPVCINGLDATDPIAFENKGLCNFQVEIVDKSKN